ncbi:hypothetical protein Q31b_21520 [Novipirellula aureliae]|uniref:Uncharacterized protein n=1 Tax=Novipirellula aureliae TaxID=2527966 RepID=A0A5C6E314_9BACT|nr:hypothetical protein [Novipirellula aureliae]TWU43115.1 hypothetical protein Q31b_21520 [Novipirellula aureliae]
MKWFPGVFVLLILTAFHADVQTCIANEAAEDAKKTTAEPREQRIANYLTGAKFIGHFTVDGATAKDLKPEHYTISKCEKLPTGSMYRLTVRIRYGNIDSEVPIDLKIVWAENTPVISVESLTIPGLGTFATRVVIHQGRYAGTWQHDEKGGHLFGRIETASERESNDTDSEDVVVFEEDFEDGLDAWEILDPDSWKQSTKNGNTTFEITARYGKYKPPVRSPLHVALIKDLQLSDFDITFKVHSTLDTGNHRDCCVFFAYQDDHHFYYVHLGARPDPNSGQIMIVNEASRRNLTNNETPTPWDNRWHVVRLVRNSQSGLIAIYFDDMQTPHIQVTDKTFTTGRIGIGSFDDMNEFDDIVVRKRK